MAHVLIAYATRHGQTKKIAQRIAAELERDGHAVQLLDTSQQRASHPFSRFDAVVIGAPIYAGGYPRSLARFVRQQAQWLETMPSAFFSVGLAVASRTTDGRAETQPTVNQFLTRTRFRPRRVELFAGSLPYTDYNPLIRFIMRRIAKQAGGDTDTTQDYEYTDWNAVDRFAREIARDAELYRDSSQAAAEARSSRRKEQLSEPATQPSRLDRPRLDEPVADSAPRA